MGLFDAIKGIFGGGGAPSFGNVDPNSIESYVRADHEIDQAERKDPQAHASALTKWGFANATAWEKAKEAIMARQASDPNYGTRVAAEMQKIQMESMQSQYQMPQSSQEPIEGVTLELLAAMYVRYEAAQAGGPSAIAAALGQYGVDEGRYQRAFQGWMARMGGGADAMSAAMLGQSWAMLMATARADFQRTGR